MTYTKATWAIFIFYIILVFVMAFLRPLDYDEVDSNALPVISLQYRFSTTCNQGDIIRAKTDFPELYATVNVFDDLRNSRLVYVDEEHWMPFYFPIYPLACIPIKVFLQIMCVSQERTFALTNACLVALALYWVIKKLKATERQKLSILLLLICSPVIFYINYINYEVFIFSLLIISIVQYLNKKYCSSAFILSLAGMSNQTVMATGIVMIVYYLVRVITKEISENKKLNVIRVIKNNFVYTAQYACCYFPCLVPIIWRKSILGTDVYLDSATTEWIHERIWAYFADINLGIASFAFLQLVLAIILVFVSIKRKKWSNLFLPLSLIGTVMAFSLMYHICCGMRYCARYIVWSFPLLAIFVGMYVPLLIKKEQLYMALVTLMCFSSFSIITINRFCGNRSNMYFNYISSFILDRIPALYSPIDCIFYARNNHVDGSQYSFNNFGVSYYVDSSLGCSDMDERVRKIQYRANKEQVEEIRNSLTGSEEAMEYLNKKLDAIPLDNELHYLNFSRYSKHQFRKKTMEERERTFATPISFSAGETQLPYYAPRTALYALPIHIKPNTVYKIEFYLGKGFDFDSCEQFFIDFCGEGYDSPAQERNGFLRRGQYEYVIYFDSGEMQPEGLDVYARVVYVGEQSDRVVFDSLKVTEMQKSYYGKELEINFAGGDYNAVAFVEKGISHKEDGFSWTLGDSMHVEIPVYGNFDEVKVSISVVGTFGEQSYRVLQGEKEIASGVLNGGGEISFMAAVSDNMIEFDIDLPDSKVVSEVNLESTDGRKIALQIYKILINNAE